MTYLVQQLFTTSPTLKYTKLNHSSKSLVFMNEEKKDRKIRILSIDGGGIRGIIPAKFLAELENELANRGINKHLYQHFDLICGTSTGALLAIGVALGVPSKELLGFYKENAKDIFPSTLFKVFPRKGKVLFSSMFSNKKLRSKLMKVYGDANGGEPPLLMDLKTNVCIPTFNGGQGEINVLKTKHHEDYIRDYKLPAHDVALSSAAAPVYFPPHTFRYDNEFGSGINVNMIDGGIFANNPALIGLFEASEKMGYPFEDIELYSIGTGKGKHIIKKRWLPHNIWYWLIRKPRLLDIILDSQAQITEEYINFLQRALIKCQTQTFHYHRVQHEFGTDAIELNVSAKKDTDRLESIGGELAKKHIISIVNKLLNKKNG